MVEYLNKRKGDILFFIIMIVFSLYITSNYALLNINGQSMYPTYQDGDIVILKKSREPKKEEIVVFNAPHSWDEEEKMFIKRIVAVEGDTVSITPQKVIVNEKEIPIDKLECELVKPQSYTLNKNEYFVMGDNRKNSNDSASQLCLENIKDFILSPYSFVTHGEEKWLLGGE